MYDQMLEFLERHIATLHDYIHHLKMLGINTLDEAAYLALHEWRLACAHKAVGFLERRDMLKLLTYFASERKELQDTIDESIGLLAVPGIRKELLHSLWVEYECQDLADVTSFHMFLHRHIWEAPHA